VRVVILGRGKLGRALSRELQQRGVEVVSRDSRGALSATSSSPALYVLAVSDGAISVVAERLAPRLGPRDVVLHCAGARGSAELDACSARGAATGVLHPMVSFASRRAPPVLAGTTLVAHGSPRALRAARWLGKQLAAQVLCAPVTGPAYHAAAALLANGSAALAYSATRILVALGISQREAERALSGLLASVASNVRAVGVPAALTGPVARGDKRTVAEHTRALTRLSPELAAHYRQCQPLIQACADALRLGEPRAQRHK